jgi:hypothetical protein
MSVLTTLALMATAVVAKLRDPEVAKLKAKIDDLESELEDVRRTRDGWRALAENWRERALQLAERQRPQHHISEAMRLQAQAQMQSAQAQQINMMQNVMNQQNPGLLAQYAQANSMFCNCVPARHDLFRIG